MSHPLTWPKGTFFYPIGDTPPVCLTQYLAPEEPADVLVLGCGDPRSILFTIHADPANQAGRRQLDFTCCDIEPAVLARNVLLLTLFVDHPQKLIPIWDIFYHFLIDQKALSLLSSQCEKLLSLSPDLETWHRSPYPFLHMCDIQTLTELRRCWTFYLNASDSSSPRAQQLRKVFATGMRTAQKDTDGFNFTAKRSAGVAWMNILTIASKQFQHFWDMGTTATASAIINAATYANPTFAYSLSGDPFPVHHGTNPLLAFHLTPALVLWQSHDTADALLPKLVREAHRHFEEWAKAYLDCVAAGRLTVRLFAGDAMAFCDALAANLRIGSLDCGLYVSPWSASRIVLEQAAYGVVSSGEKRAPVSFNVIDSSNLMDHLGLMNVLIPTIPLLQGGASATLYTETLLLSGEDPPMAFAEQVCGDMMTMGLLLGVVPLGFISGFTTQSNVHELLAYRFQPKGKRTQYHERIAWKSTAFSGCSAGGRTNSLRPPFEFDNPGMLGTLLFSIYQKIFAIEISPRQRPGTSLQIATDLAHMHYVRGTFARLLQLFQPRVARETWESAMETLTKLIETDRKIVMGTYYYQDLCCYLQLFDLCALPNFQPHFLSKLPDTQRIFADWSPGSVPPISLVVLVVPRPKLAPLEDIPPHELDTPVLQCETLNANGRGAVFSSIKAVFGTLACTGIGEYKEVAVTEDTAGFSGHADLVVMFRMPTWLLLGQIPDAGKVRFSVKISPQSLVEPLQRKLGEEMEIFQADLVDGRYVHVVRDPYTGNASMSVPEPDVTEKVTVALESSVDGHGYIHPWVSSVAMKADVTDMLAKKALAGGAAVAATQISPCVVRVEFEGFKAELLYPCSIDGSNLRTRIARKSAYIEVVARCATLRLDAKSPISNIFPVFGDADPRAINPWNVHRVDLDRLPVLDVSRPQELSRWLYSHVSFMMSDREQSIAFFSSSDDTKAVIIDIKGSLNILFIMFSGIQQVKQCIFGLKDPEEDEINTLIFVAALRLDLAAHTIVADAYVLPLTPKLIQLPLISNALRKLAPRLQLILTPGEAVGAWKKLLPAFTERCRDWTHITKCDYLNVGQQQQGGSQIPLSLDYDASPLCGCGLGKSVEAFSIAMPAWKELGPFVTRAAISPLFAVSYLESIAGSVPIMSDFAENGMHFPETPARGQAGQMPTAADMKRCQRCRGDGKPKILQCSRCKGVVYCSVACQKADWAKHKAVCKSKPR